MMIDRIGNDIDFLGDYGMILTSPFNIAKDAREFLFLAPQHTTLYLVGKQGPARFSGFRIAALVQQY